MSGPVRSGPLTHGTAKALLLDYFPGTFWNAIREIAVQFLPEVAPDLPAAEVSIHLEIAFQDQSTFQFG